MAVIVGRNRGRVIIRKRCQDDAFSTVAASIASLGILRSAAPMTNIANPVIDQTLAKVTTSSGLLSRRLVFGDPNSDANAPPPVVEAYHVMPAVTAGIIHATTTMPPTIMRIHGRARMRSDANTYPRITTPTIEPTMKTPVTRS